MSHLIIFITGHLHMSKHNSIWKSTLHSFSFSYLYCSQRTIQALSMDQISILVLCYETLPVATIKFKTVQKDCPRHAYHLSSTWNFKIAFKWKESTTEAKGGLFTERSISTIGKNNRISSARVWLILGIFFIINLPVILIVFTSGPAILLFFSRGIIFQNYWSSPFCKPTL